jgi:acetyl esterase/lipase
MLTSDTIDYSTDSADGLKNNLIIKIMQVVWKNCQSSDAKVHESQTPPTDIVKHKDIAYIDDGNMYHMLDVYYPENTNEPLPVIIDIHGGGWMYATKDLNEYYCLALAERGYVVFNISYRLVPDVTVNEQLQDVAEALKWISENTSNYPCDTSSIMLTGDSAGGQLAIYSAIIMQSPELQEIFGTVDIDMDITKLLLTSPVSYMRNGGLFSIYTKPLWGKDYKNKSTYDYMDLDKIIDYVDTMPPVYLITSSGDFLAHTQTVKAYELLKSKGFTAELADYDKKEFNQSLQHVFSVLDPFDEAGKTAIDNALEYLNNAQ